MRPIPYSQLNERQLAQADYLFADSLFGTDASAFIYEVDTLGNVTGRFTEGGKQKAEGGRQKATGARAKQGAPVTVHVIEEVNITKQMIAHAQASMDALAVSIARKLYQSQQVEEVIK